MLAPIRCTRGRGSGVLDIGLMVQKTADGRVLFAVPWLEILRSFYRHPRTDLAREPQPFKEVFTLLSRPLFKSRAPSGQT
jgi:glycerol-3-phosphate dehydrogenase